MSKATQRYAVRVVFNNGAISVYRGLAFKDVVHKPEALVLAVDMRTAMIVPWTSILYYELQEERDEIAI